MYCYSYKGNYKGFIARSTLFYRYISRVDHGREQITSCASFTYIHSYHIWSIAIIMEFVLYPIYSGYMMLYVYHAHTEYKPLQNYLLSLLVLMSRCS